MKQPIKGYSTLFVLFPIAKYAFISFSNWFRRSKIVKKFRRIVLILSTLPFISMASSCSVQNDINKTFSKGDIVILNGVEWYDYGNGLINLSDVSLIRSSASIAGEVMPRDYYNNREDFNRYYSNLDEQRRKLFIAQADFCFGRLRAEGTDQRNSFSWPAFNRSDSLGSFESAAGARELGKMFSDLKPFLTPEFAEMCVLKVNGTANLMFDDFTVTLEPFEEYLAITPNREMKYTQRDILSQFDAKFGELQRGKTPWDGTYGSLTGR